MANASISERSLKATKALQRSVTGQDKFSYQYIDARTGQPRVNLEKKILYVPVFGYMNIEDDALVRFFNIHELAHVKYTAGNKDPKWSKLLGDIINALEDNRIERAVSLDEPGIAQIVMDGHIEVIKRYASKIDEQKNSIAKVLFALQLEEMGYNHTRLDAPARRIYDRIADKFKSWRNLPNSLNNQGYYEVIELGVEIEKMIQDEVKKIKEEREQAKKEQEKKEQEKKEKKEKAEKQKQEKSKEKSKEKSEQSEEGEDGEPDDGSYDDGSEQEETEKKSKKSKKSEKKEDEEKEDEGSDDEDNEGEGEGEEDDEENEGESEEDGETDEDEKDGDSGEGEKSEDEKDEDEKSGSDSDEEAEGEKSEGSSDDEDKGESEKNEDEGGSKERGDSDLDYEADGQLNDVYSEEEIAALEKDLKEIIEGTAKNLEEMINESMKDIAERSLKDCDYLAYTDKDVISTVDKTDEAEYRKSYMKINAKVRRLQQVLEQSLLSRKNVRKASNLERGKFDVRKCHKLIKSMSKNVFYKKYEGENLNTAVSLLIDESGSMGSSGKDDMARALAIALGETLDKIKIPFEILGFTTARWEGPYIAPFTRTIPLQLDIFKNFSDKYQMIKTRLGMIQGRLHNIDGESVKFAGARLQARKELRKVLFVLSDGRPEGQLGSGTLNQNLKEELARLRKDGVEVYSFGIKSMEPVGLYGSKFSVYVPSAEDLGEDFFKKLTEVLEKRAE